VVVTSTLPEASRFSRSPAFSTALAAVGVQMPETQLMLDVAAEEMVTAACAADAMHSAASTPAVAAREDMRDVTMVPPACTRILAQGVSEYYGGMEPGFLHTPNVSSPLSRG